MAKVTYADKPWLKIYEALEWPTSLEPYPKIPLFENLDRSAKEFPKSLAMVYKGREFTYEELKLHVDKFATALADLGIKKGNVVAVHLPNSPQFIISVYGIWKTGATVLSLSILLKPHEIEHQLKETNAKAIITLDSYLETIKPLKDKTGLEIVIVTSAKDYSAEEEPEVKELPDTHQFRNLISKYEPNPPKVEIDPTEDIALAIFTGGTTGIPKGVMLTHYNLNTNIHQFNVGFGMVFEPNRGNLSMVVGLPLYHSYAFTVMMNVPIYLAAAMLIVPDPRDVRTIYDLIVKYRPIVMAGVPTQFMKLMELEGIDHSKLKGTIFGSSAAPLHPSTVEKFEKKTGVRIGEGYGLTEMSPAVMINFPAIIESIGVPLWADVPVKPDSVGIPLPDTEAKIVDVETGIKEVPVGEPGELVLRGPQLMKGYWPEPGKGLKDGWLYTGDIARMDEHGYFYMVDRKKDMINVSGYKVYSEEIEDKIAGHPAISKIAVVGIPDPERPGSEKVKAFIIPKEGYEPSKELEEDIIGYCRKILPPYAVPKSIEFRKELPQTSTLGVLKVAKRVLREEEIKKLEKVSG